jgi:SAM-dependent methyltransferase
MNNDIQFDYDKDGKQYSGYRRADSRIAKYIWDALGDSKTVLNIGAGAGSYEPLDRYVIAIEPSETMRTQRPSHLPPAIRGNADSLPFDDKSFDAAMAVLTVHHWPDRAKGLQEIRRVTKGPIVVMTFDSDAPTEFWMFDYCPEMAAVEKNRYQGLHSITDPLGGKFESIPIPVPIDCTDRFQVALYARPEDFLNPDVRKSQSAWKFLPPGAEERFVQNLSEDLKNGNWQKKYGHLKSKPFINCQLRAVVSWPIQ